ncbi:glutathione transferase GST 23-like [Durio zibethinus]|uniref:Glutathione transferase GST 23-like n=1 Tax=Durio zibethinus TaxID=66656 RepID=A0A6P5WU07_DURZI|nr:glutathione transferase GST 23-like [Durio zibethinus]
MEMKQVRNAMELLEGMLKGKKFFGGETVGFLDITFGWIAIWLDLRAIEEVAHVEFFNPVKYPLLEIRRTNSKSFMSSKIAFTYPKEKLVRFFKKYHRQCSLLK